MFAKTGFADPCFCLRATLLAISEIASIVTKKGCFVNCFGTLLYLNKPYANILLLSNIMGFWNIIQYSNLQCKLVIEIFAIFFVCEEEPEFLDTL